MTQEEINNYNHMCTEFLGYEFINGDFKVPHTDKTNNSDFKEWCPTYWDNDLDSGGYLVAPCNLMFHSDWNWIMEVVEAIEKLENVRIKILQNSCDIFIINKDKLISLTRESKKEAAVQAINQFLIWYNNEKSN